MRSGSLNERGLSSTAFTTLNVAALAPMPKAITNRATKVNPRFFLSMRAAKRRSCQDVPKTDSQAAERTTSLLSSRLPRSRRTARTASLRLMPCFIFSSAAISKKSRSSSSSSPSTRSFRNSNRSPLAMLRSNDISILKTPPEFSRLLLAAQRHHRIYFRRSSRRKVTRDNRYGGKSARGSNQGYGVARGQPKQKILKDANSS